MDNDQTWIEPPLPQDDPGQDFSSLPQMPPPPGPPDKGGRRWLLLGILGGLVVIIICIAAGFGIWQLVGDGTLPFGQDATSGPDPAALTQTALVEQVQEIILETDTPAPEPTEPPPTESPPTETEAPTESPTDTDVPTPDVPVFTANQALFCRTGPSSIYREVRTMNEGDSQPLLGQSVSPVDGISIWWQVEIDGRLCFVSSGLGSVEGDTSGLTVIPAPPTPSPTPTSTPTQTPTPTATP